MFRERESLMFGQIASGVFVLWCLYHLYGWWQYKVRKVKLDKKRVKEMIAQDLPGKPRYPIFSAVAELFHVLDAEEENFVMPRVEEVTIAAIEVAPHNDDVVPTEHCYKEVGANIDGPENFVDLEANLLPANTSKSSTPMKKTKRQREKKSDNAGTEQLPPTNTFKATTIKVTEITVSAAASANNEMSDLSDSSGVSDESAEDSDSQPSSRNEKLIRKESTTAAKAQICPSDDDDEINYSISSESDVPPKNGGQTSAGVSRNDEKVNDIFAEKSQEAARSQLAEKQSSEVDYWDVELSDESAHSK